MQELKVELTQVKKSFARPVLTDINLTVDNESYIAILGQSGCGKSTLMNILSMVEDRDGGDFVFNGRRIKKGCDYAKLRRENIGFIFQTYNLIPTLTCLENIQMPLLYKRKAEDKSKLWMERMGIGHLKDQRVNTLSGGEKQRVAIVRALMLDPCLLLADEPTGNLDEENAKLVFEIIKEEHEKGRGVVMITHNEQAARQAKTVFKLKGGVLHESK
ncbi:MAG: ABC transporter ATP-binding protein [Clostridia bacterium]|nr:ABC transporter ATP-binding protein [Clostridia bacterium]